MEKYLVRDWLSGNGQKGKKMVDLINRQEAIDILELGAEILRRVLDVMDVVGIEREKYSYGLKLLESNIEDIKELPSTQSECKMGHWYDVGSLSCRCSECGCKSQKESLFCPNCGADMRGEKNETN